MLDAENSSTSASLKSHVDVAVRPQCERIGRDKRRIERATDIHNFSAGNAGQLNRCRTYKPVSSIGGWIIGEPKYTLRGFLLICNVDIAVQGIIDSRRTRREANAVHRGDTRGRIDGVRPIGINIRIN